ncbi:unnamed protein product [Sphagnum jensenii]|jgi:uncharacterized protein YlxW (UPF0749 family)|uniref:Uncharacterized protein n=1 Tax=Sphagnum jensenii TaxID=128206 RepID=A0ABP0VR72_9BRYO
MAQALEAAVQEAASSHKQFSAAIDVSQNLETLLTEARAATGTISAEHTEESKANAATKKQLAVLKKAVAILKVSVVP